MMKTVGIHIDNGNADVQKAFIEITPEPHGGVFVSILDGSGECGAALLDNSQAIELAHALLAAAGEPGATSKIVSNRTVIRPHVFEIGDDVETNDGIRGHIEDFQDATVIIRTDNELLVQRSIADIEYTGDIDAAEDAK